MDAVNKTLYIPLYGKAFVSRRGILLDDPALLSKNTGLRFVKAHSMTPLDMIAQLPAGERVVFSNLYAGRLARKLYRLYEFQSG